MTLVANCFKDLHYSLTPVRVCTACLPPSTRLKVMETSPRPHIPGSCFLLSRISHCNFQITTLRSHKSINPSHQFTCLNSISFLKLDTTDMPFHSALHTCRYWALGPSCPNFDAFKTVTCTFAHYDTGRLASDVQQRGTCLAWKHYGYCGKGVGCWHEHRETGVTGLYQGSMKPISS